MFKHRGVIINRTKIFEEGMPTTMEIVSDNINIKHEDNLYCPIHLTFTDFISLRDVINEYANRYELK